MTLPYDASRCAGRIGLGPDDPVCSKRETCARYRAIFEDIESGNKDYKYRSFITHCQVGGTTPLYIEVTA